MIDLSTEYLGLKLKNPLVPSASPLSRSIKTARQLEDAGAAALVLYSLFEEEVVQEQENLMSLWDHQDIGHMEADSYLPAHHNSMTKLEAYLTHVETLKKQLSIPVIASLNGVTDGGWIEHAGEIEQAGADALELNLYGIAANGSTSAADVESQYLAILAAVKNQLSIPVTVKIGSQFTAPVHFVKQLEEKGANGVALFNRFYQPDITLDSLDLNYCLSLSTPQEALLRMHWIAIMRGQVDLSLAATGGVHSSNEVLKLLLAGADVVHLCSVLLKNGVEYLSVILEDTARWLEENEYESVSQMCGSVSQLNSPDPSAWERANYLEVLQRYSSDDCMKS